MKKALFFEKLENSKVQCHLCPHNCIIPDKKLGLCNSRLNEEGTLYSLNYNKPLPGSIDPIEKKPLYHFFPGKKIFSLGTFGCNMKCMHCQNYQTSQEKPQTHDIMNITPSQIINQTISKGSDMIAFTYNEPTIYYEYMLECSKLAKKTKNPNTGNILKTVIVSNGFINQEPLKELLNFLDAANIDLKGFNENFYKKICSAKLKPILETLKTIAKSKTWLEITNLIIPNENDNPTEIKDMCDWIVKELGPKVPLHFSAFFPTYKMTDHQPTSEKTLLQAKEIALKSGLKYVYMGNIQSDINTYCPNKNCKKTIIKRSYMNTTKINIKNNKCELCGEKIDGIF